MLVEKHRCPTEFYYSSRNRVASWEY